MKRPTEQFGAIPVRAFADKSLSAADFRLLGIIAYFDRLGRNGTGCFVDSRKLAKLSAIDYSHLARHAERLCDLGYIRKERSATDRRRKIYSVIYKENPEVVADTGDNLDAESERDTSFPEKVASVGENGAEKVANSNRQGVDPKSDSPPKRSCKTDIKKIREPVGNDRVTPRCGTGDKPEVAWQGYRADAPRSSHDYLLTPTAGQSRKLDDRPEGIDWAGWGRWIRETLEVEDADWEIMQAIDRIRAQLGCSQEFAEQSLDRTLKALRWKLQKGCGRDEIKLLLGKALDVA